MKACDYASQKWKMKTTAFPSIYIVSRPADYVKQMVHLFQTMFCVKCSGPCIQDERTGRRRIYLFGIVLSGKEGAALLSSLAALLKMKKNESAFVFTLCTVNAVR